MSVKGTLNLELTITVKNLEELVEKTEMLGRILKAEGLEIKSDGLERQSERLELLKPKGADTTKIPPNDDQVSFTAKVMAFDDTFRSDDADPIWGLAFTSKDIMQVKNIDEVLGKKQQVVVTIRKVKEEAKTEDQGTDRRSTAAQWHLKSKHDNEYVVSDTGKHFSIENAKGYTIMGAGYDNKTQREKTLDHVKALMRDLGVSEKDLKVIS
jgi:hypothetical protein